MRLAFPVFLTLVVAGALAGCSDEPYHARFELEQSDEGIAVRLDGQLVTRYETALGSKPILWPIFGPTGNETTRGYPLREAAAGEATDHPHHRSLWLGHGDVNGTDFWLEEGPHGKIVHRGFDRISGGEQATIVALSDWVTAEDTVLCQERREMVFGAEEDSRWIDFDIRLTAGDRPVVFGDTKEGTFAMRVADWLKVDAGLGGTIVNSRGQTNEAAWGQVAEWVDYYGPVEGSVKGRPAEGIAIFNHPSSYRFPTRWHVRTYGLFAANPFGVNAFDSQQSGGDLCELAPGKSLRLRYRVLLHQGDPRSAGIAQAWQQYAAQP